MRGDEGDRARYVEDEVLRTDAAAERGDVPTVPSDTPLAPLAVSRAKGLATLRGVIQQQRYRGAVPQ